MLKTMKKRDKRRSPHAKHIQRAIDARKYLSSVYHKTKIKEKKLHGLGIIRSTTCDVTKSRKPAEFMQM